MLRAVKNVVKGTKMTEGAGVAIVRTVGTPALRWGLQAGGGRALLSLEGAHSNGPRVDVICPQSMLGGPACRLVLCHTRYMHAYILHLDPAITAAAETWTPT